MDGPTWFGLFAVSAMLVCYAFEQRSPWWVLGFAGACLLGSTCGFLQGAWPFGAVEAVWAIIALRRWLTSRRGVCTRLRALLGAAPSLLVGNQRRSPEILT